MNRQKSSESLPAEGLANKFDLVDPMMESLFHEMKELSKKAPDAAVNATKVKMINRVLDEMKLVLSGEPTITYLDLLDDESLPSNSDIVLILSQYIAAAKQFKSKYYRHDSAQGKFRWYTRENP